MKKVSGRLYIARKIFDYTLLVLLVFFLLFLWQLYRGPMSVPFLKPYIIAALNPDTNEAEISVGSVNIELVRSVKPLKIIANNIVYKKNDGTVRFSAPRTSVSFSIKALLRGIIAPSSMEMEQPSVYIFTTYGVRAHDKASEITEKKLDYYVTQVEDFAERFNSNELAYPESYINNIAIIGGEVEFHEVDLGRKWILSDVNFRFNRGILNMSTELGALLNLDDTIVSFGIDAGYRMNDNKLAVQAYFGDLIPSDIINNYVSEEKKADLYQINVPVSGKINTIVDFNQFVYNRDDLLRAVEKAILDIGFQFEGGQGNIIFNANEESESKYAVSSFVLDGKIAGGLNNLEIKNADFNLGGQKVKLGFYATGLEKLLLESSPDNLDLKLTADINALNLNDLYIYWPRYIAPEAWEWCKEGIFGGLAKKAHFEFDFAFDKKSKVFGFKDLSGGAYIEDSNVKYIDTMPMVTNVYGDFKVKADSIEISLDKAKSEGILLDSGLVRIYDLAKPRNFISIKLLSNSSIPDALKLIDHPPLNFTSQLGISPELLQGNTETELNLDFELKKDLGYNDVKVKVKAKLDDVKINNIINDKDIKAKILDLEVDNNGLKLNGDIEFDEIPMNLSWVNSFKTEENRYNVKLRVDENVLHKFGVDASFLQPPYVSGFAQAEAVAAAKGNDINVDIHADLRNASFDYGFLGFVKPLGEKGELTAGLQIKNKKLAQLKQFSLTNPNFEIQGKAQMGENNLPKTIDITKIRGRKTNANAKIDFDYGKTPEITINISGNSYDLSEFFDKKDEDSAKGDGSDTDFENTPDMDINVAVSSLWSNPDLAVTNFAGTVQMRHGIGIKEAHLIGNYDYNKNMTLKADYVPKPNKEFYLIINSNAAGNTLRFLRIYNDMHGGVLRIEAKRNAEKMLIGHARIRDFSLHNTPLLTKLLTVASFTGMVDLLRGEGMTFSHFDAPFKYRNKVLYVNKARTYGNVMGMSFSGMYNMMDGNINLNGMIAPAYGLNTMIGKIPLVGNLLAGRDGTVFAADYSITGSASSPEIDINPLSALSPNSLKETLATVFGGDDNE
ncbi:MAG: AsmA-like C-terminal domain-containing protein [Alphaproteobacteria bacterium]|nr:AsmA-like C-terminal domain-containing protein [Alphaproteobacteria bacterium]